MQEYKSGLPLPSPGDLSKPGIEPGSSALAEGVYTTEPPGNPTLKPMCLTQSTLHMPMLLLYNIAFGLLLKIHFFKFSVTELL